MVMKYFYVLDDKDNVITNKMDENKTRLISHQIHYKQVRVLILHA